MAAAGFNFGFGGAPAAAPAPGGFNFGQFPAAAAPAQAAPAAQPTLFGFPAALPQAFPLGFQAPAQQQQNLFASLPAVAPPRPVTDDPVDVALLELDALVASTPETGQRPLKQLQMLLMAYRKTERELLDRIVLSYQFRVRRARARPPRPALARARVCPPRRACTGH